MRIARALRYGTVKLNVLWTGADPSLLHGLFHVSSISKSKWPTCAQHLTIILINNGVLLLVMILLLLLKQLWINNVMLIFINYDVLDLRLLWPVSDTHFGTYWNIHKILINVIVTTIRVNIINGSWSNVYQGLKSMENESTDSKILYLHGWDADHPNTHTHTYILSFLRAIEEPLTQCLVSPTAPLLFNCFHIIKSFASRTF